MNTVHSGVGGVEENNVKMMAGATRHVESTYKKGGIMKGEEPLLDYGEAY